VATTVFTLVGGVLTTGIVALLLLVAHLGATGLFLGELIGSAVMTVVGLVAMGGWAHPRFFDRNLLVAMLRYSGPLIPSAVAFWVVGVSDRFLVEAFRSIKDVGLYQMSNTIAAAVALVTLGFQQAWGPFAFSLHRDEDAPLVYADAFLAFLVVGCATATAVSLLAQDALRAIGASRYMAAAPGVFPLALGNVMMGLTYIAGLGPSIAKKTGPIGAAITAAAVLNISLNLWLIPAFGRAGAGYSTLAAESLVPLYLFWRSQRLYPVPYRFSTGAAVLVFAVLTNLVISHAHIDSEPAAVLVKCAALLLFVPLALALGITRSFRGTAPSWAVGAVRPGT
jgi:O-antigen/teichoic acid export membrane protein